MKWLNIQGVLRTWAQHEAELVVTVRKRFTIAEINAGADLVSAASGYKIRMVDAAMIAVGGAVTGATTVDILATLAGASRKLMASAVANLTQSALLRAGGTGGALLADGASHTPNDIGTKITVGKTGASAATATHVDVIFLYVLEKI
jgi:hypothetical protein